VGQKLEEEKERAREKGRKSEKQCVSEKGFGVSHKFN